MSGKCIISTDHEFIPFIRLFQASSSWAPLKVCFVTPYLQFYSEHEHYSLHGKDRLAIGNIDCRTILFKYSYFNRVVDSWNCLPKHIRDASNVSSFKSMARHFIVNK